MTSHGPSPASAMAPWGSVSTGPSVLAPHPLFLLPSWSPQPGPGCHLDSAFPQSSHPISPSCPPKPPWSPCAGPGLHHLSPTFPASFPIRPSSTRWLERLCLIRTHHRRLSPTEALLSTYWALRLPSQAHPCLQPQPSLCSPPILRMWFPVHALLFSLPLV